MSTVTGFTKERMQTIEDSTIVGAVVSGDDLILTRHDGTTIDAGNVRGPQGIQGPGGSDIASQMELLSPVGGMQPFGGAVAPTGWLICDGSSLLRTTYSALFSAIGTAYNPAADSTHFNLPDLRLKIPIGKTATGTGSVLGSYGGSKDAVLPTHNHNHSHPMSISTDGDHTHAIAGDTGFRIVVTVGGAQVNQLGTGTGPGVSETNLDHAGGHTHSVSAGTDATPAGVDPTDGNLQPYVVVNWIIRY